MQIAIIDDGINEYHYNTGALFHNIEITTESIVRERVEYDSFLPSHGTACAAIIKKYSPNASLSSIKIMNATEKGRKEQLVKAIEWCADNGIKLISLSLGTTDYRDFELIEGAVNYADSKGVIIVAACNNFNVYTAPASFSNVIGVKCDLQDILVEAEFIYNDRAPDGIEITAYAKHELTKHSGEKRRVSPCNSFAAPLISSYVHDIMEQSPYIALAEIKDKLKQAAVTRNVSSKENITSDFFESIDAQGIYIKKSTGRKIYSPDCEVICSDNSEIIKENIDIPIIAVHDYYCGEAEKVVKTLANFFRWDGYNAIAAVDSFLEGRYDNGMIPIRSFCNESQLLNVENLKTLNNIYNPDILIIGAEVEEKTDLYLKELKKSIEIDILVLIFDYYPENMDNVLSKFEGSEIIILSKENLPIEASEYCSAVFKSTDTDTYIKLYNHIKFLFESNA